MALRLVDHLSILLALSAPSRRALRKRRLTASRLPMTLMSSHTRHRGICGNLLRRRVGFRMDRHGHRQKQTAYRYRARHSVLPALSSTFRAVVTVLFPRWSWRLVYSMFLAAFLSKEQRRVAPYIETGRLLVDGGEMLELTFPIAHSG